MPTPTAYVAKGSIVPMVFVKLDGTNDFGVVTAGANEKVIGASGEGSNFPNIALPTGSITVYHATTGQNCEVWQEGDEALVKVGSGGVTAGADVKSDASGYAVLAATTSNTAQNIAGIALQSASAGEYARIRIQPRQKVYPALS